MHAVYLLRFHKLSCIFSNANGRIRLNRQHGVVKQSFDGRLILAPVELKPGDRVLDSGTGAGMVIVLGSRYHI